ALEHEARELERRLEERKLAALAEFAAGAGHEINNPLAVISGQAQHLQRRLQKLTQPQTPLEREGEAPAEPATQPARQEPRPPEKGPSADAAEFGSSLQTIINQTQRIHALLRAVMQFARPAKPRPVWVDLHDIVASAVGELQELAAQRHVRLE